MRPCDHPDCAGQGLHRAPKGRERLNDYYWFCLDHVRDYNRAWDFYAGMSAREIEAELRLDVVWPRPSWPLGGAPHRGFRSDPRRIRDYFGLFGEAEAEAERAEKASGPRRGSPEADALAVFDLDAPVTLVMIKARYKELVKLHHPDANGGDKQAEERLKVINHAYTTLKTSLLA